MKIFSLVSLSLVQGSQEFSVHRSPFLPCALAVSSNRENNFHVNGMFTLTDPIPILLPILMWVSLIAGRLWHICFFLSQIQVA